MRWNYREERLATPTEDGVGATDSFRTEAAVGLHLCYFIGSHFSLSSDLHDRRWLSHPMTLSAATGARVALSDADTASATLARAGRPLSRCVSGQ